VRLIDNAFWQTADQVVGRGLLFLFYVAVPLLVGVEEYGRFAFLQALLLVLVQPALSLGLEPLVVGGAARGDRGLLAAALAVRALALAATAAIVALLAAASAPESRGVLWLLWLHQGLLAVLGLVFAEYRGRESMRMEAVVGVSQKAMALPLLGVLALAGVRGALLPAAALALAAAGGVALLAGPCRRELLPLLRELRRPRLGDARLRHLLREGARLGLAGLVGAAYFRLGSIALGLLAGREAVGAYAAAFRILEATQVVPTVAMNVALPRLARASERAAALRLMLPLAAVGAAVSAALYLASAQVIAALYGAAFAPAAPVLRVLALAVAPIYAGFALTQGLMVTRRSGAYLRVALASVALNLALNAVAIPLWGASGAALATVVTELAVVGLCLRALATEGEAD